MLHGAKVRDVLVLRYDDKTAGVLARRALYADAARRETVFLRLRYGHAALFEIFFHIAVGRLFRKRADRARAEHMVTPEELFGVFMSVCLIFAGEVQVDIGNLVAAEAEERFKRDIKAVLGELRAAHGADTVRHVRAAAVLIAVRHEHVFKVGEFAFRTAIVRREGVDLRNSGHVRHQRGADASPAADEVAMLQRVLHELLCGHVNDLVMPAENGVQFFFDARCDELRRAFAVKLVGLVPHHALEILRRVRNGRRKKLLRQEFKALHAVGDSVRRGDDDVAAVRLAEIRKLPEHFIGRFEIERQRLVRVRKFTRREKNMAVNLVLRLEKMHVAGRNDELAEPAAEREDTAVKFAQILLVARLAVVDEEVVVAQRLDFQIIVERCEPVEFGVAPAAHDGVEDLARLARRADEDTLAVPHQQALRNDGILPEVLQMRFGDELIEILEAGLVLHEQRDMPRAAGVVFTQLRHERPGV